MDFQTYEREAFRRYADFAEAVLLILKAAIRAIQGLHPPQTMSRAKDPSSLKNKLIARGIADTNELEHQIKDLAGCRLIFYTNEDVLKLRNSRLIRDNFEVIDTKIHHPGPDSQDELYIADHYLVQLRTERLALPEYARFAGMRCEVQIQTILNHAWAEMAHDRIYKKPAFGSFGASAFENIKGRMQEVMRRYLLPAGYEFENIVRNYDRLLAGKQLFDQGAIDAIVESADNNARAEALDRLANYVLPHYDDVRSEYLNITRRLVQAVKNAQTIAPVPIETPFGSFPGKTAVDIMNLVVDIFDRYLYVDVDQTFDILRDLYLAASTEKERAPLMRLAANLAKHEIQVWSAVGPGLHRRLVDQIAALPVEEFKALQPMLVDMLRRILGSELTGSSSNSEGVTISRGAVPASNELKAVRQIAIDLLKSAFSYADSDVDRLLPLQALTAATHRPGIGHYPDELLNIVLDNTSDVIAFYTHVWPDLSYELRQKIEHKVLNFYRTYHVLPLELAANPALAEARDRLIVAANEFRAVTDEDRRFGIYKLLVGFESVFPLSWNLDHRDFERERDYRVEQIDQLFDTVTDESALEWFDILTRCAHTRSIDMATFPFFGAFLKRLGREKPGILLDYIGRMDDDLSRFLPAMLTGLMEGPAQAETQALLERWVDEGKRLVEITWHLRSQNPFEGSLLQRALAKAIEVDNDNAVRNALLASVDQYEAHPGTLIERVFMPALRTLSAKGDRTLIRPAAWFSWRDNPLLQALDLEQASTVLQALVPYPQIDYHAEDLLTALALRWPEQVLDFFTQRHRFAQGLEAADRYDVVPYDLPDLKERLQTVPNAVLATARRWFDGEDGAPDHLEGGHLVAVVFPILPETVKAHLLDLIENGDRQDITFVLSIMRNYEGQLFLHDLCKDIVERIEPDDQLVGEVEVVLQSTGVMVGDFGRADTYMRKKQEIEPWLEDPRTKVRAFAYQYIHSLEQMIREAQQDAERSIALRKIEYGEDP